MNRNKNMNSKIRKMMKKGAAFSLCALLAAGTVNGVGAWTGMGASVRDVIAATNKGSLDVSDIVEEAMPSVVSITTISVKEVNNYYGMYGFGFGTMPGTTEREVEGRGSGIILGKNDDELLIATNYHVVQDANTVTVTFVDGTSYECHPKGYDDVRDLAVVAVYLEDVEDETLDAVKVATIGSSDDLKVGEQVVAIGNALGYGQSVTTGIVSAKNRKLDDTSKNAVDLIQTDAAINPGNSGGALLNMDGELVGINSAKMASTDVEGMGYAISISAVKDILENLMTEIPREKVEGSHGVLGITGSTVSADARQYYGIPEGVHVAEVVEGGAADNAGIKKNFIITRFDGKDITTIERLVELLEYYAPGEEVEVVVEYQEAGEYVEKTVTVILGEDTSKKDDNSDKDKDKRKDDKKDNKKDDKDDSDEYDDEEELVPGQEFGFGDLEDFFFGNRGYEDRDDDVWGEDDDEDYGSSFWN